jgi:uncharacterized membrane protein
MALVLAVPAASGFPVVILGKMFFVSAAFMAVAFAFVFIFLFVVTFAVSLSVTVGESQSSSEGEAAYRAGENPFCVFHFFMGLPNYVIRD